MPDFRTVILALTIWASSIFAFAYVACALTPNCVLPTNCSWDE